MPTTLLLVPPPLHDFQSFLRPGTYTLNEIFAKHFATFQTPKEAGGHFYLVWAPFVPNLFLFCKKSLLK